MSRINEAPNTSTRLLYTIAVSSCPSQTLQNQLSGTGWSAVSVAPHTWPQFHFPALAPFAHGKEGDLSRLSYTGSQLTNACLTTSWGILTDLSKPVRGRFLSTTTLLDCSSATRFKPEIRLQQAACQRKEAYVEPLGGFATRQGAARVTTNTGAFASLPSAELLQASFFLELLFFS